MHELVSGSVQGFGRKGKTGLHIDILPWLLILGGAAGFAFYEGGGEESGQSAEGGGGGGLGTRWSEDEGGDWGNVGEALRAVWVVGSVGGWWRCGQL